MSPFRERAMVILTVPAAIAWVLAPPITFVLNVVDTWQGQSPVWLKLIINLTLDVVLAAIWPITWMLWFIFRSMGRPTPLDLLF